MKPFKFISLSAQVCALAFVVTLVGSASAQTVTEAWVRSPGGSDRVVVGTNGTMFLTGSSTTMAYSQAGVPLWTNGYSSTTGAATAIAVGSNGTVFVTGYSHGGSSNNNDYATIAYSQEGVPLWTNRYRGFVFGDDRATAVTVGTNCTVFVTGYSSASSVGTDADYVTIAYSQDGIPLWTNRYNGSGNGNDQASALALGTNGTVIVTGKSYGYTTIAYSPEGIPLWTNSYGAGYEATAMAVDTDGTVFVTGYASGSGGFFDYATIAYSHTGLPLWTNRYSGLFSNSDDRATALALGTNGTVFVTGYSGSSGGPDYATIAYSHEGILLWTNRYNGTANAHDYARSVAVDASGHVFVTGTSYGSGSSADFATIAYTHEGVPLSTNRYNSPENYYDGVGSMAIVPDGVVVLGGSIYSRFGARGAMVKYKILPPGYNTVSGLLLDDGEMKLSYMGLPSTSYALDRTFNLAPPDWIPQTTNSSGADGVLVFTNTPYPDTNNYWRIRSVP